MLLVDMTKLQKKWLRYGNWSKDGYVNIIGGCCGTTPEHIFKMKQAVEKFKPRNPRKIKASFRLSGLEPFNLD